MGYVTRTVVRGRTRRALTPTKKALDLVENLTPHAFQVEQETLAGLTEDEAEMFRRLVKRVWAAWRPLPPTKRGRSDRYSAPLIVLRPR